MSVTAFQMQREKKKQEKNNRRECPRTMGQLQKIGHLCNGRTIRKRKRKEQKKYLI